MHRPRRTCQERVKRVSACPVGGQHQGAPFPWRQAPLGQPGVRPSCLLSHGRKHRVKREHAGARHASTQPAA
eukprot:4780410-Lingulodinium_polyedra.AAC.1